MDYLNKLRNLLGNVGNAVGGAVQQVAQSAPAQFGANLASQFSNAVVQHPPTEFLGDLVNGRYNTPLPTPTVNSSYYNTLQKMVPIQQNYATPLVQNRINLPAQQIGHEMQFQQNPNASYFDKLGSRANMALTATNFIPQVAMFNSVAGGLKSGYQAHRLGQDTPQGFAQGYVGNNTPGLGTALTDNPVGQFLGNLAEVPLTMVAMNPKGSIAAAKNIYKGGQMANELAANLSTMAGQRGGIQLGPKLLSPEEKLFQVFQELDAAEPGARVPVTQDGQITSMLAKKSSFPSWVPQELRSTPLFNKVKARIINGPDNINTANASPKEQALLNAIMDRVGLNQPSNPLKSINNLKIPTKDEFLARAEQTLQEPQVAIKKIGNIAGNMPTPNQLPQLPPNLGADNTQPSLKGLGQNEFANWVNSKKAIGIEKQLVRNKFEDLRSQGMDPFFKIQEGDMSNPRFNDVRKYLDTKYQQAKNSGFELPYRENYLTQIWNNTPQEISNAFSSKLSNKPGFTMERAIQDYKTGIEAGLTPKYNNIPDLLAHYEGAVNKALADRTFINGLTKQNLLLPQEGAPAGWQTLNPDKFPRIKYNLGQGQESFQQGPFKAPAELAQKINNHLFNPREDGNGFQKGLNKVANFTSNAKNMALSFGIPGTAINAHGVNILARHTLFGTGGNPLSRFITASGKLVYQGQGIGNKLEDATKAVKSGLTLSAEEHNILPDNPTLRNKFGAGWNAAFEKPLFDRMIPDLKLSSWKALVSDFAKKMPQDQAEKEASKLVNNVYGGINWEQMGRSREWQDLLRAVVLAPDWAETTLKMGGNMAKSFVKGGPIAARYRTMMATLAGSYIAANVSNKLSSGHFMWENDPGHTMEVEAGYTSDGQKRYIRPYGTAVDFARLPYDSIIGLLKGDPSPTIRAFTNRLSIPAGAAAHIAFNQDYTQKPIYGKDKFGNAIPPLQGLGGVAGELATGVGLPSFIKQGIDTATGKQGVEQGVLQALELPVRYSGGAYSKSQQTVAGIGKAQGLQGKDLYNLNKKTQGLSLTQNQSELLRQGGLPMLDPIMQLKQANSQQNQVKTVFQKIQDGTMTQQQGDAEINKILNNPTSNKQTSAPSNIASAQAASPQSIQAMRIQDQLTKMKVEATGQPIEAGGKYYYPDPKTGTTKAVDLNPTVDSLKLTGDTVIDKQLLSDFKGSVSSAVNDNVKLFELGKITQSELRSRIDALQNQVPTKGVGTKKIITALRKFTTKTARTVHPYKSLSSQTRKTVTAPKLPVLKSGLSTFKPTPFKLTQPKSFGKKLSVKSYL